MASSITPQTVTIKITEESTDPSQVGSLSTWVITFPSITFYDSGNKLLPSAVEESLLKFVAGGAASGAGTFRNDKIKYLRITNTDDTNFIRIAYRKTGAEVFYKKILPHDSFIVGNLEFDADGAGAAFAAYAYPDEISIKSDTAACVVNYSVILAD